MVVVIPVVVVTAVMVKAHLGGGEGGERWRPVVVVMVDVGGGQW